MKNKDCKIVCNGKEIATILCSEDGFNIRTTAEGKKLFSECDCKDCC